MSSLYEPSCDHVAQYSSHFSFVCVFFFDSTKFCYCFFNVIWKFALTAKIVCKETSVQDLNSMKLYNSEKRQSNNMYTLMERPMESMILLFIKWTYCNILCMSYAETLRISFFLLFIYITHFRNLSIEFVDYFTEKYDNGGVFVSSKALPKTKKSKTKGNTKKVWMKIMWNVEEKQINIMIFSNGFLSFLVALSHFAIEHFKNWKNNFIFCFMLCLNAWNDTSDKFC